MCGQEQIYIESDIKEEYDKKIRELKELDDYINKLNTKLICLYDKEQNYEYSEVDLRKKEEDKIENIRDIIGKIVLICALSFIALGLIFAVI